MKKELVDFCRENGLPVSDGKSELTDRIACFLDTGKILRAPAKKRTTGSVSVITEDTLIEHNIVCSEKHLQTKRENSIDRIFFIVTRTASWPKWSRGSSFNL